jgi:glycosyltransferase involved in cell wall biosynthesis
MQKSPKVSVCMPVYNRPEYVAEAIESVLQQTFTDFELIITDNCSTDNTPEVIKSYAAKDNRVKYFRNERNLGVCSSGNRAMLLSRGEYIKQLFSDDKLSPRHLEVFVEVLDNHPKVSLVTSYTQNFGKHDHIRGESYFPGTGELDGKTCQKDLLISGNWAGSPSSIMFRRRDLHIGLGHQQWKYWMGDLDISMRLLSVGNAYVVPEILSFLRVHDEQQSTINAVDFRLIKERLMLTNIAFWFPHIYGDYAKAEQKAIHRHLLKRLIREGIGKRGLKPKMDMIRIGLSRLSYNRMAFCWILLKNLRRLFRKSRWS